MHLPESAALNSSGFFRFARIFRNGYHICPWIFVGVITSHFQSDKCKNNRFVNMHMLSHIALSFIFGYLGVCREGGLCHVEK